MGERPGWIVTTVQWTLRCVSAQIVRRIRLPADHSSPGVARVAVRAVVTEAGLDGVLDEALLLTTELTTNGILHAGTDLDVEIIAGDESLTVSVLDARSGPIINVAPGTTTGDLDERGRGLLLVDRLASAWGTLHFPTGKGVWFRL